MLYINDIFYVLTLVDTKCCINLILICDAICTPQEYARFNMFLCHNERQRQANVADILKTWLDCVISIKQSTQVKFKKQVFKTQTLGSSSFKQKARLDASCAKSLILFEKFWALCALPYIQYTFIAEVLFEVLKSFDL